MPFSLHIKAPHRYSGLETYMRTFRSSINGEILKYIANDQRSRLNIHILPLQKSYNQLLNGHILLFLLRM